MLKRLFFLLAVSALFIWKKNGREREKEKKRKTKKKLAYNKPKPVIIF